MARSLWPESSGRDQRQQGLEVGGEVDVHVGDHGGVAGAPHLPQGPAPALLVEVDGADVAGARSASRLASGQVASVLALSAMVIRKLNGKLAFR